MHWTGMQQSQMGPSLLHLYTYCKPLQNLFGFFFGLTENYREITTLQCIFLCVATSQKSCRGQYYTLWRKYTLNTMCRFLVTFHVSWLLILIKTSLTSFPEGPPFDMFFSDLCKSCHSKNTLSIRKHMNRKLLCWKGSRRRKQNMGHERERFSNVHVCHTNGKNASHAV